MSAYNNFKKIKVSKKGLFYLFILSLFLSPLTWGADKPTRVALISSSGVNNDFRSWGEYDEKLQKLGWQYDKFRNTELDKFFSKSSEYNLVLTTSLWNYGDPQDMKTRIPQWKEYLEQGGILILTDMAYPPMSDWLSSLDPDLYINYGDATRDLGIDSQLDLSQPSPFLNVPNKINVFPYWAHFPRWGKKYYVWARTKGGTAIGLYANLGKGILVVTTGFAFSTQMLENLYANALMKKSGVEIHWQKAPLIIPPGEFRGEILIKNLVDDNIRIELQFLLKKGMETVSQTDMQEISISPKAEKNLVVTLPCIDRGEFFIVARFKTERMEKAQEVFHSFKVPPLVELDLNRTIFTRSDKMKITIHTAPKQGEKINCQLLILDKSDQIYWNRKRKVEKEESFTLPLTSLTPGEYLLRVIGETKSEKLLLDRRFKISEEEKPAVITKIGGKGELLLNGKLFFPLGTYHVGTEDLPKIKEMGFNCVTSPIYGGKQRELTPTQLLWHNTAQKNGLFVIPELSSYIRDGRRNFEEAKDIVSQLRLHPATIAHYVIDEPSLGGIGKEVVKGFCDLVKEVDPEHITFICEVPGTVVSYAGIADVTGTDPYPIGSGIPKSLAYVGETIENAVKASGGKPVWGIIQAHRQPPAHSQNRYPTPDELRCMSYLALNHGAKGILFYAWDDVYKTEKGIWESGFKFNSQLMDYFPNLLKELKEIGEWYLLGEIKKITAEPSFLDVVLINYKGKQKIVAINPMNDKVEGKIKIDKAEISHQFLPFEVFFSSY